MCWHRINDSLANGDATIKLQLISSRRKGEGEHEKVTAQWTSLSFVAVILNCVSL